MNPTKWNVIATLLVSGALACGSGTTTVNDSDSGSSNASQSSNTGNGSADATSTGPNADTPDASADGGPADMAAPTPLEHFLYVVELSGVIHWYDLGDPAAPSELGSTNIGGRVTFGAFHPLLERLYVTNESRVEGYEIGGLEPMAVGQGNTVLGGTHLEVTADGNAIVTASYGGDAVIVNPLQAGVPQDATQTIGGSGSGVCARAHQVRVHPGGRWVYVPCLGDNHVAIFEWDGAQLVSRGVAETGPDMGPRHLDFHPALDVLYVLGEVNSTVEVFDIDLATGGLSRRQTTSTMADRTGASASSDIHVSPDGRFLYAMNRQPIHDLALFTIDPATGDLTWVENVDSGGEHSRSFTIHPDQSHLYVGNSDTRDMAVFSVASDGRLTEVVSLSYDARVWFVGVWSRPVGE